MSCEGCSGCSGDSCEEGSEDDQLGPEEYLRMRKKRVTANLWA